MNTENLVKAGHSAGFLLDELRRAHKDAIASGDQFAEMALLNLIDDAVTMAHKVNRAVAAAAK